MGGVKHIDETLERTDLCEAFCLGNLAVTRHLGGSSRKKRKGKRKIYVLLDEGSGEPSQGKITDSAC